MEVKEEIKTVAFVYKWTHIPSLKWYVGSRTAKGCHPDDGYLCSSKIVKPLIQNNPKDWVRTIIDTGSPKEMINLEAELLIMFDAKNDPMSFNMHNSDGKFFYHTGKESYNKGRPHSPETRAKISEARKGQKMKPLSHEHRARIAATKIKTVIATNLRTGETFEISGRQGMNALGFTSSNVSSCANGKRASHKGHTFKFKIDNEPTEKDVASHQPAD